MGWRWHVPTHVSSVQFPLCVFCFILKLSQALMYRLALQKLDQDFDAHFLNVLKMKPRDISRLASANRTAHVMEKNMTPVKRAYTIDVIDVSDTYEVREGCKGSYGRKFARQEYEADQNWKHDKLFNEDKQWCHDTLGQEDP